MEPGRPARRPAPRRAGTQLLAPGAGGGLRPPARRAGRRAHHGDRRVQRSAGAAASHAARAPLLPRRHRRLPGAPGRGDAPAARAGARGPGAADAGRNARRLRPRRRVRRPRRLVADRRVRGGGRRVEAVRQAVRLARACIAGEPYDVAATVDSLQDLYEAVRLGPSTAAIVEEARRRGIPVRRRNSGSLVQLGLGKNLRRIQATLSDFTSAIAVEIAQDKDETRRVLGAVGLPVPDGSDTPATWRAPYRSRGSWATPCCSSRSTPARAAASPGGWTTRPASAGPGRRQRAFSAAWWWSASSPGATTGCWWWTGGWRPSRSASPRTWWATAAPPSRS
jgi:hypothetical protein